MKLRYLGALVLLVVLAEVSTKAHQAFSGHKSEAQIARMTPEERIEEYCREYARHSFWHSDYVGLLNEYINRDGLKSIPGIIKVIDEFDPTRRESGSAEKDAQSYVAWPLLARLDGRIVRLRAVEEGRRGLEALKRLIDRMRAAHFDAAIGDEYAKQLRFESAVEALNRMRGVSFFDQAIADTLRLRYGITLSSRELLDFVNHLISQDPSYPSWSVPELYQDLERRNEAGNPLQYAIVKDIEPFHRLYLQYKAKSTATRK